MVKKKVTVFLLPDEGGYAVFFPLFPECTTQGETIEEALKNAKESLELTLEKPRPDDLDCLELSHVNHVVVSEIEVEVPVLASASATTR